MKDFYLSTSHIGRGVCEPSSITQWYMYSRMSGISFMEGLWDMNLTTPSPISSIQAASRWRLNPNVFPSDQIEWMQVDATCMALTYPGATFTAQYRTGLGLQPRGEQRHVRLPHTFNRY